MRRASHLALAALLAFTVSPLATAGADAGQAAAPRFPILPEDTAKGHAPLDVTDRYLVTLRDGKDVDKAEGKAKRLGVVADKTFKHALKGYAAKLNPHQLAELRSDPDVEDVVPDEVFTMTEPDPAHGRAARVRPGQRHLADQRRRRGHHQRRTRGRGRRDRRHGHRQEPSGPQRRRRRQLLDRQPAGVGRRQRPRDARRRDRRGPRQLVRGRRGGAGRPAVGRPDPRLGRERAALVVRVRPGLDRRPT